VFIAYHTKESCNTSSIAQEFAVTKPTVSDAIRVLIEKKLLQKKRDAQDARAFVLQLTAKGKEKVKTLDGFTQPFGRFLDNAKDHEIESVWHGLLLLMEQLQHSNIIPMRMCYTCDYFGKEHPEGSPHYCRLMKQPLSIADIRIDCPEHQVVSE
jgi:DNA-binding MarR family transcriptional regulator